MHALMFVTLLLNPVTNFNNYTVVCVMVSSDPREEEFPDLSCVQTEYLDLKQVFSKT